MSVTVKNVGEAGRGLVALKDIKVGELIDRDTAVIAIPANVNVWEAGEEIVRQLKKMSSTEKEEFYNLTRKDGIHQLCDELMEDAAGDTKSHSKAQKLIKNCNEISIFFNNDIATDDSFRCLFLYFSLLNHSCDPNSFWTGSVKNPRQLELRAAKDIKEGEEVTVNYILVEGRFIDRPTRHARLREGWGFYCKCSLCQGENLDIHQQKQEILKQEIIILQSDMISECDQNPATVSWARLCTLQSELVELVGQLTCEQLLLGRELKSLANLAQLARREDILDNTLNSWDLIIQELGVERWRREYNFLVEKLRKWTITRKKKDNPNDEEIRQFLWLM
eukprot:GFUD01125364.1.p1 GENE.GFUD01125364.1~~GFUD01125364.1.p1  ORF type:complete len:335 (-),score=103.72 GFUD01125364.1:8-1012(-)